MISKRIVLAVVAGGAGLLLAWQPAASSAQPAVAVGAQASVPPLPQAKDGKAGVTRKASTPPAPAARSGRAGHVDTNGNAPPQVP